MTDLVKINIQDHVADVRLNRARKMNALNPDMFRAITDAAKSIENDKSVRAVVLSGEGKAFCAGIDTSAMGTDNSLMDVLINGSESYPNIFQQPAYIWKQLSVPVIGALHGAALGGGFQIALGTDIRFADPQTKLSVMEIRWGLIPDMSATQTLRDLVRIDVAKELTYTGRIFDAVEGKKLGVVSHLSDKPRDDALALAREIASKNPDAISAAKHLLNETWHGNDIDGLQMEERLQGKVVLSENQQEAVNAEMEGRKANYKDRI